MPAIILASELVAAIRELEDACAPHVQSLSVREMQRIDAARVALRREIRRAIRLGDDDELPL
jgi:hypothetical protein